MKISTHYNNLILIFFAYLFIHKPTLATECSESLNIQPAFFTSPEHNVSHNLIFSVFGTKKSKADFVKPRKNIANLLRRAHNLFYSIKEIGIAFGGTPRLSLIEKPEFKTFLTHINELTPFGEQFANHMKDKIVIDLGSGLPELSFVARILAQLFAAKSYTGVDRIKKLSNHTRVNEFDQLNDDFTSSFVQVDMLDFLKNYTREGPTFFMIEGIEFDRWGFDGPGSMASLDPTRAYLESVMQQIANLSEPGDVLFVGNTVSFLHPTSDIIREKLLFEDLDVDGYEIDPKEYGFERVSTMQINRRQENATNGSHDLWLKK
ncbi:MAG: hypothetical protein KDD40_00450 [Bdellovibrionales bacterium]|nr:hypothetical protein [Bdellovibrionales bacterium]